MVRPAHFLSAALLVTACKDGTAFVEIRPAMPIAGRSMTCVVSSERDASVSWTRNGESYGSTKQTLWPGDTIPSGVTRVDDQWTCAAQNAQGEPFDGKSKASIDFPAAPGGNILLIIADDMGIDQISAYNEHPDTLHTPILDSLAARGVLFRNAYAQPLCSPARAAILTGRDPRRFGLGANVRTKGSEYEVPVDELSLPTMLTRSPVFSYSNAAVGKWHLSSFVSESGFDHASRMGFAHWSGSIGNLGSFQSPDAGFGSYYNWEKYDDGDIATTEQYATRVTVNDALEQIETLPEPWLVWVAFNAGHIPTHVPPPELMTLEVSEASSETEQYRGALQAVDTEIGNLLGSMDPRQLADTTVIFLSDNGSIGEFVLPPWDPERAKATLYEGGINVPMIVAGPLVRQPGSESQALVHVTDLFATAAEIAGVDPANDSGFAMPMLDSISMVSYLTDPATPSSRAYIHVGQYGANGEQGGLNYERTVRDARYKLIQYTLFDEFYDLEGRSFEGEDLLAGELTAEQHAAYERLSDELARHVAEVTP